MNALSAALQSGSILLREGLEAMLIIAALAAIVRRAGATRQIKELYVGALLAVLASLAAARAAMLRPSASIGPSSVR